MPLSAPRVVPLALSQSPSLTRRMGSRLQEEGTTLQMGGEVYVHSDSGCLLLVGQPPMNNEHMHAVLGRACQHLCSSRVRGRLG
jgi:hypothetical protein